jgi:hypothetical protein
MFSQKVISVSAALCAVFASGDAAQAAVKLCRPSVTSGLIVRPTEFEARKEAMAIWKAKAMEFGEPYSSWRLASERLLHCLPRNDGSFECVANGMPCTVEQAPDRRHLRENRIPM